MSYYLIQQIAGIANITVRTCTEVAEAHGDGHLEQLTLRDISTGEDHRNCRCRAAVHLYRGGTADRPGWTAWWPATIAASCWPART